ncbi:hypothetical protein RSAG8_00202, partial [Rhizoctonia solani AG-8 WAC10335]
MLPRDPMCLLPATIVSHSSLSVAPLSPVVRRCLPFGIPGSIQSRICTTLPDAGSADQDMPQATRDNFRRSTLSSPGLSGQSSLANTWERIRKFMAREYPELGDSLNFGLAPAIIDQVEAELGMTLPRVVRESYLLCDGQEAEPGTSCAEGLFFGLTLLPLEDVLDEWRFWREVDEDPTTGANPQLLQVMASIPTGWIRKAYSPWCRNSAQLCNQLQTLEMNNILADFDSYTFARLEKLTINVNRGSFDIVNCLLPVAHRLRFLEIRDIAAWRVGERIDPEPVRGVKVLRLRHPNPFCRWELEGDVAPKDWDVIDFHLPHNLTTRPKGETRRNLEYLIPYMRANSSKITSLTLDNNRPEILERINTMLQVLPNLHTLTFDNLDLTESILSLFIPPPDSSDTFPRFHTLRLLLSSVHDVERFKTLILSHPIRRLDLWHSIPVWGDGVVGGSCRPTRPSPFYEWLCERVPELYISEP